MKPPKNVKSLQSFLGLVNYLTRYSGRLATLSAPLKDLTKKDTAYSSDLSKTEPSPRSRKKSHHSADLGTSTCMQKLSMKLTPR